MIKKIMPTRFISDCDKKIFSEKITNWLSQNDSSIFSAPEGKQRQNRLCERFWKTVLRMARGWTSSALLPPPFWWWAFKRAVEVSNYIPLKVNNKLTTPHELVYHTKPDLRNLLPMFSVCYLRRYENQDDEKLKNIENHSIAVILVGRSKISNSPLFYHPHTKKLITSDDFLCRRNSSSRTGVRYYSCGKPPLKLLCRNECLPQTPNLQTRPRRLR